jgi:hypothetical protein
VIHIENTYLHSGIDGLFQTSHSYYTLISILAIHRQSLILSTMRSTLALLAAVLFMAAPLTLASPLLTADNGLTILKRDVSGGFFCCCGGGSPCVVNVDLNCALTLAGGVCAQVSSTLSSNTLALEDDTSISSRYMDGYVLINCRTKSTLTAIRKLKTTTAPNLRRLSRM